MKSSSRSVLVLLAVLLLADLAVASDWPEWRGDGRLGEWHEADLVSNFPAEGLKPVWRVPIHGGYAGPAVSEGKVFVTDFERQGRTAGVEGAVALDEETGKTLWRASWRADYVGLEPRYAIGPRATPTVAGEQVFVLGAMGHLQALSVADGTVQWQKDFVAEYGTEVPVWGMSGSPIVHGEHVIALVGGEKGATVVAFDKKTGTEAWRSIKTDGEPGYASPVLFDVAGRLQLIVWHPKALFGLDPESGDVLWRVPFDVTLGLTVASPVLAGDKLLVSSFFNGSLLVELGGTKEPVRELWRGKSSSEVETDGLHALITTPVIAGDTIYGVGSYGQLRALDLETGERLWESMAPVVEKARWAAAFIVRQGDRYLFSNDRGELILAELGRDGYRELDRADLIEPTSPIGRREKKAVHWSHPAYANGHIIVRNDREILRVDLRRQAPPPVAENEN